MFVTGFLLSLSLCLDLGIVNVAMVKTGIERGFLPSLSLGFGSCFGDLAYALLSMVGMTLLLEYTVVRWILWIGGTLFLLKLTYDMLKEAFRGKQLSMSGDPLQKKPNLLGLFGKGVALAMASPSAILWFATVGGSLIAAQTAHAQTGYLQFLAGFFTAGLLWSLVIAFLSSRGRKLMGGKLLRSFSITSALIFLYFAAHVFWNGYTEFVAL
ncbi:LysE family transporter [Brevibacillus fulvus]|uniref:L-lysine exporter family protein LysE/ArgO n=1 Tax=Brevibacillus fulvus TaxID=1125967 RepID=A0A938XWQ0_9BACL|nr:L-lysine exporter family protein LysE/ArgO [Brevibacillus fulvus]